LLDAALPRRHAVASPSCWCPEPPGEGTGTQAQTEALELTAYLLVLTSADSTLFSAKAVLDLYRGRWPIELVFKRLKSLLEAGHVPKTSCPFCRSRATQSSGMFSLAQSRMVGGHPTTAKTFSSFNRF
jgi:hypothetical protein